MKVLAINGSPRAQASSTHSMLEPLLDGMRSEGAEATLLHVRELELESCLGCFHCWTQTPGECIHADGMKDAIEAYRDADLVVYGTPLYHGSMSGLLKTFLDRLLPQYEPWLIPSPHVAGMTGHPRRWIGPRRMLLVSPCGFPEFENFDALVFTFRHMAKLHGQEYVGEILRPFGEPLSRRALRGLFAAYREVVYRAGQEVVRDGTISEETREALRRDLLPGDKQAKYEMANAYWTQRIGSGRDNRPRAQVQESGRDPGPAAS